MRRIERIPSGHERETYKGKVWASWGEGGVMEIRTELSTARKDETISYLDAEITRLRKNLADKVAKNAELAAENARLRDLLNRVFTVCKTDLHIKGVLSQLGADILEALEDKRGGR